MRQYLILLALVCASAPALSETAVIQSGAGRACYIETLLEPTPENNRRALAICDQAVDEAEGDKTDESYNHAASLVNRAAVYLRLKKYENVISDSKKAIALYQDMAQAYANLGAGMIGLERYDEALTALNTAIDLNGNEPERAYFNRALAKENLGDIRGAYFDYGKASQLNPNFQPAAEQLARFKIVTTPN